MHKYMKAIGFQHVKKEKDWKQILTRAEELFTGYERVSLEDGIDYCELKKEVGMGIGICSYGQVDENEVFEREYYIPYFEGTGITSYADIIVEHRSDREAYVGICEDAKIGVSLIFHLQNGMEYLKEEQGGKIPKASTSVTLSGLATQGTILFPIMKSKEQEKMRKEESRNRMMLLSAARDGDTDAIESLTMEDMDTYSKVSRRIISEDVFSIVDTYFMPYGVECDQYSVLGEILDIDIIENKETKEELYIFQIDTNELQFDVCVPTDSVIGEPMIGRRFKANIWLQGKINF